MAMVDGIFIGEPVEYKERLSLALKFEKPISASDLAPDKSEWDASLITYKKYKLSYKKMEKAQNQLTGLINCLLVGLQYFVESSDNVLSVFKSLKNFNEQTVTDLMSSLNNQTTEVLSLQSDIDSLVKDITSAIETIDGYKAKIFDTLKEAENAVEEGYYLYEFVNTATVDEGDGLKTYYYYDYYRVTFSIAES